MGAGARLPTTTVNVLCASKPNLTPHNPLPVHLDLVQLEHQLLEVLLRHRPLAKREKTRFPLATNLHYQQGERGVQPHPEYASQACRMYEPPSSAHRGLERGCSGHGCCCLATCPRSCAPAATGNGCRRSPTEPGQDLATDGAASGAPPWCCAKRGSQGCCWRRQVAHEQPEAKHHQQQHPSLYRQAGANTYRVSQETGNQNGPRLVKIHKIRL